MPARILSIAQRHLRNPARVTIESEKTAAGKLPRVRQVAYLVPRAHKPAVLDRVLDMENPASALVFCRTRLEVETLVETLSAHGRRAQALHGGMEQRQRDRVMQMFRGGKADLLTNRCRRSRPRHRHLSHVVNYDMPASRGVRPSHRATGRAGRAGTAIMLVEPREHRLLRTIEAFTKQKIAVATVPTVAEIRARQLDVTKASLRERILAGDLDDVRVVVESLAQEFDLVQVAAAAVKLVHLAEAGDETEREIPAVQAPKTAPTRDAPRGRNAVAGDVVRLFIGAGRAAGIRPGDLVGAITGEAGIASRDLGAIEIADRFSLIDVPESRAEEIVAALRATTLRGKKVAVRRDRGSSPAVR
jgi:ATP-dependent RNA helicase DeaD